MTLTQLFTLIANAIRTKKGTTERIVAENFATEISSIKTKPNLQNKSLTITENGTNTITYDTEYDGLNEVEIITEVSGGSDEYNATIDATGLTLPSYDSADIQRFLTNITNINLGNNQTTASMFSSCSILKEVPLFDTSNVLNMNNMFNKCSALEKIPQFDTSNVTNMAQMFYDCFVLKTIPLINTSKVTNMSSMFHACHALENIPLIDTSSVTDMNNMFNGCRNLKTIPLLNTSKVTNMVDMFAGGCTSLIGIPQIDTSSVTNLSRMFYNCEDLQNIPVLSLAKATNIKNMFSNCTKLTDESLNNILATCATINSSYTGSKTLYFLGLKSTNYPSSKIQSLSNYQAFIDAGWKIGY